MHPSEFLERAVGLPWVRWRSDWQAVDCFGLIVIWHREVLGVELGPVPETDIAAGFAAARGWVQCDLQPGTTSFMAFRRDGSPGHCGIVLDSARVLHADGAQDRPGSVRITSIRALRRLHGDLRFYRYEPAPC
jgi:cell wall-associated NlpC family hydrolase